MCRIVGEETVDAKPQRALDFAGQVAVRGGIGAATQVRRQELVLGAIGPGMDAQPRRMGIGDERGRRVASPGLVPQLRLVRPDPPGVGRDLAKPGGVAIAA